MSTCLDEKQRVQALLLSARSNLEDLLDGDSSAVYRNAPVFMLVIELVEKAEALVDSEEKGATS